ncbi:MAG: hypothetical protein JWO42_4041 [Chloroflexi bacterium]|nr:hypothetical protein [Chloroflexota bacterium]
MLSYDTVVDDLADRLPEIRPRLRKIEEGEGEVSPFAAFSALAKFAIETMQSSQDSSGHDGDVISELRARVLDFIEDAAKPEDDLTRSLFITGFLEALVWAGPPGKLVARHLRPLSRRLYKRSKHLL